MSTTNGTAKDVAEVGAVASAVLAELDKLSYRESQAAGEVLRLHMEHLRATGVGEFLERIEGLAQAEFGLSIEQLTAINKRQNKGTRKRGRPRLVPVE